MEGYKPNSHKFNEEQKQAETKKVDKIVNGTVTVKKKSEVRKLAGNFISEDAHNVKSYILGDVLIPAIKKLVSDIVKDGIEIILYGGTSNRDRSSGTRAPYVSYNRFSDRRDERPSESRARAGYDYDDISLNSRGEAEAVLDAMDDLIKRYGMVTVADLYDLVGITGSYTDNKYGWTNLRTAEAVRTRDGKYLLRFPRPYPLD